MSLQMVANFCNLAEEAGVSPKILFIGGGNMANSMIQGCVTAGFLSPDSVAVTTRSQQSADKWLAKGFPHVGVCNVSLLSSIGPSIIVLSVKPHLRQNVFTQLAGYKDLAKVPLVVSLMAGIKTAVLQNELAAIGYSGPVLRLMPNTPSSVGEGATLLARNAAVTPELIDITKRLAESVGLVVEVDEGVYNAAAAISGCGPAWVYMFIEALADGGVLAGCPRQEAMKLAAQTVAGAAKMVLESGQHPGLLKDQVCSPGGTTIAGVRKLETSGFRGAVMEAVKAAADRADAM